MIKVEKDIYGRNTVLVPFSDNIVMERRYSVGEDPKGNDNDCKFFLLIEIYDNNAERLVLSGELIDYINELEEENKKLKNKWRI